MAISAHTHTHQAFKSCEECIWFLASRTCRNHRTNLSHSCWHLINFYDYTHSHNWAYRLSLFCVCVFGCLLAHSVSRVWVWICVFRTHNASSTCYLLVKSKLEKCYLCTWYGWSETRVIVGRFTIKTSEKSTGHFALLRDHRSNTHTKYQDSHGNGKHHTTRGTN